MNDLTAIMRNGASPNEPVYSMVNKRNIVQETDPIRRTSVEFKPHTHRNDPIYSDLDTMYKQSNGMDKHQPQPPRDSGIQRNENYKHAVPGVYDNIPVSSKSAANYSKPIERSGYNDSDYYSSPSSRRPSSNDWDYDNIQSEPLRPLRKKSTQERKQDVTDILLERSKLIHDKKKEFMNQRLCGNNPYMKRMLERESSRDSKDSKDSRDSRDSRDYLVSSFGAGSSHYDDYRTPSSSKPYSAYDKSSDGPSMLSMSGRSFKKDSNKSLNTAPSTNRSVLDLFKRSPPNDKSSPPAKDGCAIS